MVKIWLFTIDFENEIYNRNFHVFIFDLFM